MTAFIRIVYISRSTFAPSARNDGIDPGLARILAKSRKNNRDANIVGGLLFGDGCFLQCLEGEPQAVDRLYNIIAADPRHKDVKTLLRVPIDRLSFSAWSMKYVPMEQPLRRLLAAQGLQRFDPYRFTPANVQAVLESLHAEHDPSQNYEPSLLDPPSDRRLAQDPVRIAPPEAPPAADSVAIRAALRRANWAMGISFLSLVIAALAVLRRTW